MSNFDTDNVFSEYVLKVMQGIRNSKLHRDNHTSLNYVTKNLASNADAFLIDTTIQILPNNNLIENRLISKGDFFFIKHTSGDFHEVNYKEKTNNSKTLVQATQISPLNHS